MGKVEINKISKNAISFKTWCVENRWTTTKLSKEFEKYGVAVAFSTIWYWQKGKYSPRDAKVQKILSDICGFDWKEFSNFN